MGFQKKAAMRGIPAATGAKKMVMPGKPRFGARMTKGSTPGLDSGSEMPMPAPGPAMKKGGKVC